VHPSVIANWKRQLLEGAPDVFTRGTSGRSDDEEMARLFEQIGRMKMEMEWLKKKL
jgi:putative transposase